MPPDYAKAFGSKKCPISLIDNIGSKDLDIMEPTTFHRKWVSASHALPPVDILAPCLRYKQLSS